MKKTIILGFLALGFSSFGQYKTVIYDHEKNFFNEGQPLPSDHYFMLSGACYNEIQMVNVTVKSTRNNELYQVEWEKTYSQKDVYTIPVNFKLKSNSKYNIELGYYRAIKEKEREKLLNGLSSSIHLYINQNFELNKKNVSMFSSSQELVNEMNKIVHDGVFFYKNNLKYDFPGFSNVVKEKITRIRKVKLRKSKFSIFSKGEERTDKYEINKAFLDVKLKELDTLIKNELAQFIQTIAFIQIEKKIITEYPTEEGRLVLPINVGYGGIYESGEFSNLSYGHAPYIGLSFPLGNSYRKNTFINRSSISFGAYLNGYNDASGNKVTGPIVNTPVFLGVGTRVSQVFRVNVGAVALQQSSSTSPSLNNVYLRPSINLNFEFGLWMGLLKK